MSQHEVVLRPAISPKPFILSCVGFINPLIIRKRGCNEYALRRGHVAHRNWLKRNCSSGMAGEKKFSSSAKVFTQRCVIKQERWPTKASNGCSLKCLRRGGMFFSCQPAFDAGERGGDLAPPCACDGPTQVFRTIPCCRLKLWTSFVKCR